MENDYKVNVAYFSPTSGTERAVKILANNFKVDYEDINLTNKSERINNIVFTDKELLIAACPVYAGQMPIIDGLFKNLKGDNTPCIVMATYGNRHYDDTLAQLKNVLEKNGFICIGAIASIIPHIYSEKLGYNRPDEDDLIAIKSFANNILKKLDEKRLESVEVPGEESPKILDKKPGGNVIKLLNQDICNKCGLCISKCPVSAINSDTMEVDEDICINCMKCAVVCKKKARSFDSSGVREYLEGNYINRREIEVFFM